MAMKHWLLITSAVLVVSCAQAGLAQAAGKLAGQVASAEEGAMDRNECRHGSAPGSEITAGEQPFAHHRPRPAGHVPFEIKH